MILRPEFPDRWPVVAPPPPDVVEAHNERRRSLMAAEFDPRCGSLYRDTIASGHVYFCPSCNFKWTVDAAPR